MLDSKSERKKVIGAPVDDLSMEEVLSWCNHAIEQRDQRVIVTFNAHSHWFAFHDPEMKRALTNADLVLPEFGIYWAAKRTGQALRHFILGIELMRELIQEASRKKFRLYLLGAKDYVVDKLLILLLKQYPNLIVCGKHHGYFQDDQMIIREICEKKPDILFVGMGTPRQEVWIDRNREALQVPLSIGVGGSFDVLAELKKDTPAWARGHGLEWLYRTFQDPAAYFYRYVTVNSWLLWQVIKENLRQ